MKRNRIVILLFITAIMIILAGCKFDVTTTNTTNPPNTSTAAQTTAAPSTTTGALTSTLNAGTTTVPVTTVPVTTTTPITTTTVATTVPTTTTTTAEGGYDGDSFSNPIVISVDEVKTANIDVADKYLYYQFVPATSGQYTIESSGDFDSYVVLYDSLEEHISHNDEGGTESNFQLTETLTAGQTYFIEVSMYYSTDVGSFTFVITAGAGEVGDSFANPISISAGAVQTANIDEADKYIYYQFIPATTGSYSIESSGDFDSYVELYDSLEVEISHNDEAGEASNFLLTQTLTAGQTYYIVVSMYSTTDVGSFTFVITADTGNTGDSFATAIVIAVGEVQTANIDVADKYIFYSFTPATTGTYMIGSSGIYDSYVELYDSTEAYINYDDESGPSANFLLTETLTAGQVYFIVVSLYSSTDVGSFTVVITGEAGYVGDSFANPISLSLGEIQTANIDVEDKYIYYRFIPSVSGYFTIESSGDFDTYVELYNSAEEYIYHDDEGGIGSNFLLTESLTAGETYYFVVSMFYETDVGSFTFVVTESAVFTFVTNGGTVIADFAGVVLYEAPITTREGYYFAGWYDNIACTGTSLTYPYSCDTDVTLYALWSTTPVHDGKSYATANVVIENQNYTVTISTPGQIGYYIFTPSVTGSYTVQSTGSEDTYCWLVDFGLTTILDSDDEDGAESNFLITWTMEAGTSYYIVPSLFSEEAIGSFVIVIAPTVVS